jgi:hypothetical protein
MLRSTSRLSGEKILSAYKLSLVGRKRELLKSSYPLFLG